MYLDRVAGSIRIERAAGFDGTAADHGHRGHRARAELRSDPADRAAA